MGRPQKEIDIQALIDLAERGLTQKELATEFDVSVPTIAGRIAKLQEEQGILLQYRSLRNLHLTKLQSKCLEAITPAKIADSTMLELVRAFKILYDAETEGPEGGKVKGLVAYLLQIEKEEVNTRLGMEVSEDQLLEMATREGSENSLFEFSDSQDL